eukprot:3826610-Pyramimonas_sp.AAC.1
MIGGVPTVMRQQNCKTRRAADVDIVRSVDGRFETGVSLTPSPTNPRKLRQFQNPQTSRAVSYTHLTLPTILLV